jgi:hypothetical protein
VFFAKSTISRNNNDGNLVVSNNAYHVLNGAYRKECGKDIPWSYVTGICYRLGNETYWEWEED